MQVELAVPPVEKTETSISTQADPLEPEYYIEEGWTDPTLPTHRGLAFKIPDNRHYGRCTPFLYWNGEPLCRVGPDWPYSVALLLGFFFIFRSFKTLCIQGANPTFNYALYIFAQTVFVVSFMALAVKNPGVKSQSREIQYVEETLVCGSCNAVANSEVVHCSRCDLCFDGFDHHCVWANKCIARGNMPEFVAFVVSGGLLFVYSTLMAITSV